MSSPNPTPSTPPLTSNRRRRLLLVLGCAILLLLIGGTWKWLQRPRPPEPPDVSLSGVEDEIRLAVTRAREAVLAEPSSARHWGRYGMVLRAHGYDVEADICFAEASKLDENDPRWPYYRGLHALLRDPGNALMYLRRANELHPHGSSEPSAVSLRLAEALLERNELDEAEAIFQAERTINTAEARTNYGLALVQIARGNARSAESHLMIAAPSPFARKKATSRLAVLARQRGNLEAAEKFERDARAMPEDRPWKDRFVTEYLDLQVGIQSRFLQAESLQAEGRLPEAARQLVALAESHPNPRTNVAAGIALAELGDFSAGERYLRACLELEPDHIQGNYFLAVTLFFQAEKNWALESSRDSAKAQYQECIRHARRCLERKPDHAFACQFLGRALLRLGDTAEGIRQLRLAVACKPELAESHIHLAEAEIANGDLAEARRSLSAAEQLAPAGDPRLQSLKNRLTTKSEAGK